MEFDAKTVDERGGPQIVVKSCKIFQYHSVIVFFFNLTARL